MRPSLEKHRTAAGDRRQGTNRGGWFLASGCLLHLVLVRVSLGDKLVRCAAAVRDLVKSTRPRNDTFFLKALPTVL